MICCCIIGLLTMHGKLNGQSIYHIIRTTTECPHECDIQSLTSYRCNRLLSRSDYFTNLGFLARDDLKVLQNVHHAHFAFKQGHAHSNTASGTISKGHVVQRVSCCFLLWAKSAKSCKTMCMITLAKRYATHWITFHKPAVRILLSSQRLIGGETIPSFILTIPSWVSV